MTGNLDADRLILLEVEDRELFSICIPKKKEDTYSKYAQKLCNEDFFRNRVIKYYPWTVEYKKNISWKKYYATIVFYISQMKDEKVMENLGYSPFDGLKYQGNPKSQYNFFKVFSRQEKDHLIELAAAEGELGIIKYLRDKGADIHTDNYYALQKASQKGHLEVVKYLIENGADIHSEDDLALRWASENGYLRVVKYLVEKGADIHANEDLALRMASEYRHLEVVKYLIEHGADVQTLDDFA